MTAAGARRRTDAPLPSVTRTGARFHLLREARVEPVHHRPRHAFEESLADSRRSAPQQPRGKNQDDAIHRQCSKESRRRGVPEVVNHELEASRDEHGIHKPSELDPRRDPEHGGNRDGRRGQHDRRHARRDAGIDRFGGDERGKPPHCDPAAREEWHPHADKNIRPGEGERV